jgi:N4-gp56 family major capsid protein
MTSSTIVYTVEEFNDFTNTSRLYDDTDISEELKEMVEFMSYRGALTWDNILRNEFDSVTAAQVSPIGVYFSSADIRRNVAALEGLNVSPRDGGFQMITHPYCAYDLMSDNTAGGFIDISKYAQPDNLLNNEIGKINNTRVMESPRT